jgi:hypothetical protein
VIDQIISWTIALEVLLALLRRGVYAPLEYRYLNFSRAPVSRPLCVQLQPAFIVAQSALVKMLRANASASGTHHQLKTDKPDKLQALAVALVACLLTLICSIALAISYKYVCLQCMHEAGNNWLRPSLLHFAALLTAAG